MANADATERLRAQSDALEHQLRNQRELLQVTESILRPSTPQPLLDQIADRLGGLARLDNIAIEIVDPTTGLLEPLSAAASTPRDYLEPWAPGEEGLATWVVEPQRAGARPGRAGRRRGSTIPRRRAPWTAA